MNPWISAAIAVAAGVVLGSIAARLVRSALERSGREALQTASAPLASMAFSILLIIGLVVGLGFVEPDALDTIPNDLVTFLPRAFAAAIVVIAGNVVSSLARAAAARALRGTGSAERFGPPAIRAFIMGFAAILAAAQLGVDTTIINILAAALLFGAAASMAMLIGLGGRKVAGEVAAGRAWRTSLQAGDKVRALNVNGTDIDGVVVEVHPTAIEVEGDGRTYLVPNSKLLDVVIERTR